MSRIKSPFEFIVIGFLFHFIGNYYPFVFSFRIEPISVLLFTIGWYFILKGFLKIRKYGLKLPFRGFYRILFNVYILLCLIMIMRGYMIDYPYRWISFSGMINFHLFQPTYLLPYLMPLIVLIPLKNYTFSGFIRISYYISLIAIFICIINYKAVLAASQQIALDFDNSLYGYGAGYAGLCIIGAFSVFCRKYISKRVWLVNSIALLFSILLFTISARRGSAIIVSLIFVFNLYFYVLSLKRNYRALAFVGCILIISGSLYFFNNSPQFSFIKQRGFEDTRSGVDEALMDQMTTTQKFFGKGLNGRYYYPLRQDDYLNGWRYSSETGFYTIVLRGGYVMAFVYILLLLYPALLGLFNSNNMLCKAIAFYIVLSLIELYPGGFLSFDLRFLIIWMGVSLCYDRKIRTMNDKDIYNYLFVPKEKNMDIDEK